jgi:hypothetical protein
MQAESCGDFVYEGIGERHGRRRERFLQPGWEKTGYVFVAKRNLRAGRHRIPESGIVGMGGGLGSCLEGDEAGDHDGDVEESGGGFHDGEHACDFGNGGDIAEAEGGEDHEAVVEGGESGHGLAVGGGGVEGEGVGAENGEEAVGERPEEPQHEEICESGAEHLPINAGSVEDEAHEVNDDEGDDDDGGPEKHLWGNDLRVEVVEPLGGDSQRDEQYRDGESPGPGPDGEHGGDEDYGEEY